ncbi:Uncharacterised protein [Candidatus Bilamarchaeum dharawalense]|uniref:Uncharacterized protein n=1 Tax=Candidatus Bilamarchaeum dharawalense TaxID=2885759 RepID=A0A5E4LS74_9ARCH|nr:Uncharacterised protein [Candidatus Bilamarchaeum dharawalense]
MPPKVVAPELDRTDEALNRILAQGKQQNVKPELLPLFAALEDAEGKARAVVKVARDVVDPKVGVSDDTARRDREAKVQTEVPRLIGNLEVLETQNLGGLEVHIKKMREEFALAWKTYEEAKTQEQKDKALEAMHQLYHKYQPVLEKLPETIAQVRGVMTSGAPQEIQQIFIGAAGAALGFYLSGNPDRADLLLKSIDTFNQKRGILSSESGQEALIALIQLTQRLCSPEAVDMDRELQSFEQIGKKLITGDTQRRTEALQVFEYQRVLLGEQWERTKDPKERECIQKTIAALDEMIAKLKDEQKRQSVTDEDMARMGKQCLVIKDMESAIAQAPTTTAKAAMRSLYIAQLGVLAAGGNDEAIEFAIQEATDHPKDGAYLKKLVQYSTALAAATSEQRMQAEQDLILAMSQNLTGRLDNAIPSLSETAAGKVSGIRDGLVAAQQKPEELTVDHLRTARAAVEMAEDYKKFIASATSLPPEVRESAIAIYEKGFEVLGTGNVELALGFMQLGRLYAATKDQKQREEISALVKQVTEHPERIGTIYDYLEMDGTIKSLREEVPRAPAQARPVMEKTIAELETARARMASGEGMATSQDMANVELQIRGRMAQDPRFKALIEQQLAEIRKTNPQATEDDVIKLIAKEQAEQAATKKVEEMVSTAKVMAKTFHGQKTIAPPVIEIFDKAVDALVKGDVRGGATLRDAAELYPKVKSAEDRQVILDTCRAYASGAYTIEKTQQILMIEQQRATYETKIPPGRLATNSQAYFDLALRAALSDDPTAKAIFDLAVLYARTAATQEKQLLPEMKEQRTAHLDFVEQNLGDYAATAKKPPRLLKLEEPPEGIGLTSTALDALSFDTAKRMLGVEYLEFHIMLQNIRGATPAEQQAREAQWEKESRRLHQQAATARTRGQTYLADYYERQAGYANPAFVASASADALESFRKGQDEQKIALDLGQELTGVANAEMGMVTKRTTELIAELPPAVKAEAERKQQEAKGDEAKLRELYQNLLLYRMQQHQQSGDVLVGSATRVGESLGLLDKSVRTVRTIHCTAGRFELFTSINIEMALAKGQKTDFLGNVIEGEQTAADRQGMETQARTLGGIGKAAVAQQVRIQEIIGQGVARAKKEIRDANEAALTQKIDELMGMLRPPADVAQYKARRESALAEKDEKVRIQKLQDLFLELAGVVGVKVTDQEAPDKPVLPIYDGVGSYEEYRRVVKLYYAEKFVDANRAMARASFVIRQSSELQETYIGDVRVTQLDKATMDGQPGGYFIGAGRGVGPQEPPALEVLAVMARHLDPNDPDRAQIIRDIDELLPLEGDPANSNDVRNRKLDITIKLLHKKVYDPTSQAGATMMDVYVGGQHFYYHTGDYAQRLKQARAKYEAGDTAGAESDLFLVQGERARAESATTLDSKAMEATYTAWRDRRDAVIGLWSRIREKLPNQEDTPRAYDQAVKRNEAPTAAVIPVQGSMFRDAGEFEETAAAYEKSRDETLGGRGFALTQRFVMATIATLEDRRSVRLESGKTYDELIEAISRATTPQEQARATQEFWDAVEKNPQDFARVAKMAKSEDGRRFGFMESDGIHLGARVMEAGTKARHAQRVVGWQKDEENIKAGMDDLRQADDDDIYRKHEKSERYRAEAAALGWAPQQYTADSWREFAARRFELTMGLASEENDYRAYDIIANNETITLPVYEFRSSTNRYEDEYPLYITVYSDVKGLHGTRTARTVAVGYELASLNHDEFVERTSYIDKDWFDDKQPEARKRLVKMAEERTTLEFAMLGVRREWHREDGTVSDTASGNGYWVTKKYTPTTEQQQATEAAYLQHTLLTEQLNAKLFGHSAPWGDDAVLGFMDRTAARASAAFQYANVSLGNKSVEERERAQVAWNDSTPFIKDDHGAYQDYDSSSKQYLTSMGKWQSGYRVTVGGVKMTVAVVSGVLTVVGGTVTMQPELVAIGIVGSVAMGADAVAAGFEEREQLGKWTGWSIFHTASGVVMMVLPVASEFATAGRLAGAGVEIAGEVAGGAEAVVTATRSLTFVQRAGRVLWGGEELSGMQRAIHITGQALMVSGAGEAIYRLPESIKMVNTGDQTWVEFGFGMFQTVVQPIFTHGIVEARMATQQRTGVPVYRSRGRQVVEMLVLGLPPESATTHAFAREIRAMPLPEAQAYHQYAAERHIDALPIPEQTAILRDYTAARKASVQRGETPPTFGQFAATSPRIQAAGHEASFQLVATGRMPATSLSDSEFTYYLERLKHAEPEEAYAQTLKVVKTEGCERMEQVYRGVRENSSSEALLIPSERAYVEARERGLSPSDAMEAARKTPIDRAAEMRENGKRVVAARREQLAFRAELESRFTSTETGSDGRTRYTMGRGEEAAVYSAEHVTAALDIVGAAETVLKAYPEFHKLPASRRNEIVRDILKDYPETIREGAEALASNLLYVRNRVDRRIQLEFGLAAAKDIPEIAQQPESIARAAKAEEQQILRTQVPAQDLKQIIELRQQEAIAIREEAQQLRQKAEGLQGEEKTTALARAQYLEKVATQMGEGTERIQQHLEIQRQRAEAVRRIRERDEDEGVRAVAEAEHATSIGPAARRVLASSPEQLFSQDRVTAEILRRAGFEIVDGRLKQVRQSDYLVRDEPIEGARTGMGRMVESVEDYILAEAAAGREVDVIAFRVDKKRLNPTNAMLGMEVGDAGLSAYEDVV